MGTRVDELYSEVGGVLFRGFSLKLGNVILVR